MEATRMRRGYIDMEPSRHKEQRKGLLESTNLKEKRMNSNNDPSNSNGRGVEKKLEAPDEAETEKLERKATAEDINASADAFIKNFRQQLLIQRLQSLENYEQMLARGL